MLLSATSWQEEPLCTKLSGNNGHVFGISVGKKQRCELVQEVVLEPSWQQSRLSILGDILPVKIQIILVVSKLLLCKYVYYYVNVRM